MRYDTVHIVLYTTYCGVQYENFFDTLQGVEKLTTVKNTVVDELINKGYKVSLVEGSNPDSYIRIRIEDSLASIDARESVIYFIDDIIVDIINENKKEETKETSSFFTRKTSALCGGLLVAGLAAGYYYLNRDQQ